jgi:hydroxypyruvate reductase/glycerate 2-kinase
MRPVTERRLRDDALAIWKAGVAAVEAGALVRAAVVGLKPQLESARRVGVVGAGKAAAAMADALELEFGAGFLARKQVTGWVNVPDATVRRLSNIRVHGARTLPDNRPTAAGVIGAERMLEVARSLSGDDVLLVLLSGGGSALLPLPVDGVSLEDKLLVTKLLQERGATIEEMNCVRKHLSQIKGGRLAQATKARVVALIVSDVIGDPLDVIASGPTAPDRSTFEQALVVLSSTGLRDKISPAVLRHLDAGLRGDIEETPKSLDDGRVFNVVIGNGATARVAAMEQARWLGYVAHDVGDVSGDTAATATGFVGYVRSSEKRDVRNACLISGGETTVNLGGASGKGGRNQEFALAVLNGLGPDGLAGVCVLCGGTDGEDGPTDAAGALVDEDLARDAVANGLDPADFLRRHDAYNFFDPLGGLVRTGPTNTNVMDLRVVLIDRGVGAAVPALTEPSRKRASAELQS